MIFVFPLEVLWAVQPVIRTEAFVASVQDALHQVSPYNVPNMVDGQKIRRSGWPWREIDIILSKTLQKRLAI